MLHHYLNHSSILLLLGADHGRNGSCARVAGSRPVAGVGFDDDHLNTVVIDDRPDLVIELAAITLMKAGTLSGGLQLLPGSLFQVPPRP